ncbi:hypothetical protein RF11_06717 [Thelohanellus kitauei]|uniref:Uncharacterized protein n=1 Tax=Thelohanellus kitauei TaxID=669202 RepID=A0A0C2N301_THEKT|nr:hypothetical protein RF11_06717 [Thelohanellus kitauei]
MMLSSKAQSAKSMRCHMCKQQINFIIPKNNPIVKCIYKDTGFIGVVELIKQIRNILDAKCPNLYTDCSKVPKYVIKNWTDGLNFDIQKENVFMKNIPTISFIRENCRLEMDIINFCDIVISENMSFLTSTLSRLEKLYRHMDDRPCIFNYRFIQTPKYETATQFARYCFYTCGLAQLFAFQPAPLSRGDFLILETDCFDPETELMIYLKFFSIPSNPSLVYASYKSNIQAWFKSLSTVSDKSFPSLITRVQYLKNYSSLVPLPVSFDDLLVEHQNYR